MSQSQLITRLVVGEPRTVRLGRPVGQQGLGDSSGTSLRWRDGQWVLPERGVMGRLERFKARFARPAARAIVLRTGSLSTGEGSQAPPQASAAAAAPRRPGLLAWTLGLGATVCALIVGLQLSVQKEAPDVAVPPAATGVLPIPHAPNQQVKVLDSDYVPPAAPSTEQPQVEGLAGVFATPEGTAKQEQPPLPIAIAKPPAQPTQQSAAPNKAQPPAPAAAKANAPAAPAPATAAPAKIPAPAPVPPPVAAAPPKIPAPAPAQVAPAKAPAASSEQASTAVVFDADVPPASRPATAQPAAGAAEVRAPQTAGHAGAGPVATARPAGRPAAGLIAVTPDGKMAVFTNPSTKLPQPFKVGDQLPSGDTIRSIDAKDGKVITTTKEYSLE